MTETEDFDFDVEKVDIGFRLTSMIGSVSPWSHDDPDDLLELYGTSPYVIGVFMFIVTVFLPIGGINLMFNFQNQVPQFYSAFWLVQNLNDFRSIFNIGKILSTIWMTIPLCSFNFLFVIQINRFFSNTASRDVALMYGILSMIAPTVITIYLLITYEFPFIVTPIPIQFFIGVVLLYKFRGPDYVSPWKGYFLDWSWWIRRRHSMHDSESKVINLSNLLMQHDADWLEGWLVEDVEP